MISPDATKTAFDISTGTPKGYIRIIRFAVVTRQVKQPLYIFVYMASSLLYSISRMLTRV